jgi:hypothetical protein
MSSQATKDMEEILKHILLSKRSQYEKATHYMILTTLHSRKGKTTETTERSVVTREEEKQEGKMEKGKRRMKRWSTGDLGTVSLFYMTV